MLKQRKNNSSYLGGARKMATLLATTSAVNGIAVTVGHTKQWIYIKKDTTRDPDLVNPSDYCPDINWNNGNNKYNSLIAERCLTSPEDGGKYAVYKN